MSIPCEFCGIEFELSDYEPHTESHRCGTCGEYDTDEHKCSNVLFDILSRIIEIKQDYEQKANSLEMFMKNEKDLAEKMREAGFSIGDDFTFVNNDLVSLNDECENFIFNFRKEKADEEEEKKKDEKTKLEIIDLEKINFIQECSESECNICEEQTNINFICSACDHKEVMCVECSELMIRNRYHMNGGENYISCMTCRTKLEF